MSAIAYYLVFGVLFIAVVAGTVVAVIAVEVSRVVSTADSTEIMTTVMLFIMSVAYAVPILIFYAFFKLRKKNVKEEWRFNGFSKQLGVYASGTAFFLQFAWLFFINKGSSSALMRNELSSIQLIAVIFNSLLVAPFCHQTLMNGIIYTRAEKGNSPLVAGITVVALNVLFILLSNLVTAFAPSANSFSLGLLIRGVVYTFLSETFYVWLFSKSRSLWLCILTSAVSSIPGVIMQFFNYPADGIRITLCVVSALCGAVLLYLCIRRSSIEQ